MNRPAASIALAGLLAGCATHAVPATDRRPPAERRLVVLHASDLESELLGNGSAGGIGRFVGVLDALRSRSKLPTITVAAGDTFMPAPALGLEIDGENPVTSGNGLAGFQASAIGNHELDEGESFLAGRIRASAFPYLSATIDPAGSPLAEVAVDVGERTPWLADHPGRLLPRGLLCAGGTVVDGACTGITVGVIGATTETLHTISGATLRIGLPADKAELRRRIQAQADALAKEGVDIVVLLSHLQDVTADLELIEAGLTGVDVIVSGGGDDRLANEGDRLLPGDTRDAVCAGEKRCYPILRKARDGSQVAVVATDGQLRYVGRLALAFDERGRLCSVGEGSRPWPVDDRSLAALDAAPAPAAVALEARVRKALRDRFAALAARAPYLDGDRDAVRNRETNLGNLSADSILHEARKRRPDVLFALRNGGSIRASIGTFDPATGARSGGTIRPLDIAEALRFDDELVVVTTTRRVLVETLESALRGAGTGRGHFPQVSEGVELHYDPAAPEQTHRMIDGRVAGVEHPGSRVRRLVAGGIVLVEDGRLLEPDRPITFATLDYLVRGGDGWFPGAIESLQLEGLGIGEQAALAAYLRDRIEAGAWEDGRAYAEIAPASRIRPVQ